MLVGRTQWLSVMMAVGLTSGSLKAEGIPAEQILAGADARIERIRKGDGRVRVVDAGGKPVCDAAVRVEQTRHAFLFGCNIFMWGSCGTPEQERAYRQRFTDVFNYATLGFYWSAYEGVQGKPNHAYWEQRAKWCKEHGIATKGHPLAWNCAPDPAWLPDDPDRVMALQSARITDCVRRFRGLIDCWDVVNEPTMFNLPECIQAAPKISRAWQHVGQIEFSRRCFQAARSAGPRAALLVNDFVTSPDYAKVIEQLVDDSGGRMYDAIGIQSHMRNGLWSTEVTWRVCERFARFGVPLHFTETSIPSGFQPIEKGKPWTSTPPGEAFQARQTERFYTVLFSHPAVQAITWWDLSDQGACRDIPAGWLDRQMRPKPVYLAMKKLIKNTWWTKTDGKTDTAGEFRFRGFKGRYRVTATAADGSKGDGCFDLADKGEGVIRLGVSAVP